MPRVKVDYVVSFSSEDSDNPASNLLANEVSRKKWLCSSGEPSCSVVLQLTHAVQISTVHIGAYHAALVEVLVGRSETPSDQYEVLVPSSVFVSPMDSRRGSGVERVRSFSAEQLAPARGQRWDRVRVVCSQPYNKHCKYGLSFVHLFESDEKSKDSQPGQTAVPPVTAVPPRDGAATTVTQVPPRDGAATTVTQVPPRDGDTPAAAVSAVPPRVAVVGNYSSDEDDFRPGELFAKHLIKKNDAGTSTEAQIRQASSQALKNIPDSSIKLVKTNAWTGQSKPNQHRHSTAKDCDTSHERNSLMYTDDDDLPNTKIDFMVQRNNNEKQQDNKKKEAVQNMFKKDKHANRLETASKNFKEFLDTDLNSSRSKDSKDDKRNNTGNSKNSRDDSNNSRIRDTSRDDRDKNKLDNSISKDRNDDRRNKDSLNNSKTKTSSRDDDKRSKVDHNSSRSKDSSRDTDRRNRDDEKTQSRAKTDNVSSGESRKRQHSDDRQKAKDVLRAGPISSTPHTLLRDVVFALSGYENPRRARIRDAAVAMGANFQRDWNPTCTHLICAFPNTPKLRTVRSSPHGSACVAALGEWVEQCCEKRRLLPWQWFATEPAKKVDPPSGWDVDDKPASECDTDDEIEKVLRKQKKQRTDKSPSPPHTSRTKLPTHSNMLSPQPHTSKELSPKPNNRAESPKPHRSRDKSPRPSSSKKSPKRNRELSPKPNRSNEKSPKPHSSRDRSPHRRDKADSLDQSNMSSSSDVQFVRDERIQANITIDSGESTDEDKPVVKVKLDKESVLPDFFDGYTFVIDDGVEEAGFDKELLSRYVKAYGGIVLDASQLDSESEISYIVSCRGDRSFGGGTVVRADWVWRCHQERRRADVDEYTL